MIKKYDIEKYVVIKDKKIVRVYETSQGIEGIKKSLILEGIKTYDEIKVVPESFEGSPGMDIREWTNEYVLRSLSKRIADGFVLVPDGYILDGERIRKMTLEELVNLGKMIISPMMKVSGEDIIPKTDQELIDTGVKTAEQIAEEKARIQDERLIYEEMRRLAIANIKDNLQIVRE